VAAGTDGQAGSVIADLDVPNFTRGALVMSGVAVASAADADVLALRTADPLREALPGTPTTRRSFDRSDDLALYLEVYENGSRLAPHTITVQVELRQAGRAVFPMIAETRASTEATRPNGGHPFQLRLPLQDVPPGRYVLHVEAESDAQRRPAIASHAIPIEVR
jgi:hypothetical protein